MPVLEKVCSKNKLVTFLGLLCLILLASTIFLLVDKYVLTTEQCECNITETPITNATETTNSETTTVTQAPTTTVTQTPTTPIDPGPNYAKWRLPKNKFEIHEYNLKLMLNIEAGLYSGQLSIKFNAIEKFNRIKLHSSKDLSLTKISIDVSNREIFNILNNETEILDLKFDHQDIDSGNHTLYFEFNGEINDKLFGFYRTPYINEHNQIRYIATTKFEPTYARQAFPCFDEPNYKAKYTIQIETPFEDEYIALSNMNQIDSELVTIPQVGYNSRLLKFNTSVPMSTYDLCFIVCNFKYTEQILNPSRGHPIKLRIYATPAQKDKTKYALEIATNLTYYYVNYFEITYPLPKLDMIAIPYFDSGAMAHWGLLTYKESTLLFDEKNSNADNMQSVATAIAHELAQQWFGNMVTMDWWNDLWLNKGFATYMQFKAVDSISPEWTMEDQFLIDKVHPAMDFDANIASHPVVHTVHTPNQITEIFDSISYNKGAAVLRMLENAMGDETFRHGIHNYLDKYKYDNAVTENLWNELQKFTNEFNVQEVMDTWTLQMGYPVVNVKKEGDKYILTQKRFLAGPETKNQGPSSVYNYTYSIPITYVSDNNMQLVSKWFHNNTMEESLTVPNSKWVKINYKQTGYYRVNYAEELWDKLTADYYDQTVTDKANLLDDSFALAKAGELHYKYALNLSKILVNEKEFVAWSSVMKRLKELQKFLKPYPEIYTKYQAHVQKIIGDIYSHFHWEIPNGTHLNNLLRIQVLDFGCSFGMKKCIDSMERQFNDWLHSNVYISVQIKEIIYVYGMEEITKADWNRVFEIYMNEKDELEKLRLLHGLTSTSDIRLLRELLARAENDTIVKRQDYFTCLQYISMNKEGTDLVWKYVRENWSKLVDRFTLNDRYLGQLIPTITSSFTTECKLKQMEEFFAKYPEAGAGEISREQALENIKNNIKWNSKYQKDVGEWLEQNQ